jgi:hypothetical protein
MSRLLDEEKLLTRRDGPRRERRYRGGVALLGSTAVRANARCAEEISRGSRAGRTHLTPWRSEGIMSNRMAGRVSQGVAAAALAGVAACSGSGSPTGTPTGPCDGITSVATFEATMDYTYSITGVTEGGFRIDAQYGATLSATLASLPAAGTTHIWTGPLRGSARVHESKDDNGLITRVDGDSVLFTGPALSPALSLIADLTTCTYRLTAITALQLMFTQPDGAISTAPAPVANVQVGSTTPLGAWRGGGLSAGGNATFPGHSSVWAALNPQLNAFVPLGFAAELMERHGDEPFVGVATVRYVLLPR